MNNANIFFYYFELIAVALKIFQKLVTIRLFKFFLFIKTQVLYKYQKKPRIFLGLDCMSVFF
jgi:hypothetical protein